jgi:hypothetical protein
LFLSGDETAKPLVAQLIADAGFEPADLGGPIAAIDLIARSGKLTTPDLPPPRRPERARADRPGSPWAPPVPAGDWVRLTGWRSRSRRRASGPQCLTMTSIPGTSGRLPGDDYRVIS